MFNFSVIGPAQLHDGSARVQGSAQPAESGKIERCLRRAFTITTDRGGAVMVMQHLQDWTLDRYYRWRSLVPASVLYHSDHFLVRRLLLWPPAAQAAAIEGRLRHLLAVAVRHVPFYKRTVTLSEQEITTDPPSELLNRFPYISKSEVMANQIDFVDERLNRRWLRYATSHGSFGEGIGVWRNKRQADIEKAFYHHEWGKLGFSFDRSRYLRIGCDASRPLDEAPFRILGNRLLLSPDHLTPQHRPAIITAINRFKPQYIHSYPSTALTLAEMLAPGDLDVELRGALLASEPAAVAQLSAIGRAFHCPVSISYGLTERTNLAFARHHDGTTSDYQFEPLYGVTETRETAGQREIVGTSLWNDVMPLIRYCTADFAQIDEAGRCEAIEGRLQEFVVDRDGNHIPGLAIALDASSWDFVRACQIRQCRPGELTLLVVPRHGALSVEEKVALTAGPRQFWGSRIDIAIQEVAEIPQHPSGKRRFVVSELMS